MYWKLSIYTIQTNQIYSINLQLVETAYIDCIFIQTLKAKGKVLYPYVFILLCFNVSRKIKIIKFAVIKIRALSC